MKRILDNTITKSLLGSDLWTDKIKNDCLNQNVFFTIRDNRIDLYHKGGKLFGFDSNGYKTHIKFAAVISKDKNNYLTEKELSNPKYLFATDFKKNYKRIKENCKHYSGLEALGVSELYHKYSYLSNSEIIVLDIEVSFQSLNKDKKQDRIDILLYDKKNKILQFVEAKHYTNPEIWSSKTPKVIKQIKRYESQIKDKQNIIREYSNYIKIINNIFNINLQSPKDINDKVTLLIFGFDSDQKQGKLKTLIKNNSEYSGIKLYSKGDIKSIVIENIWKAKVLK